MLIVPLPGFPPGPILPTTYTSPYPVFVQQNGSSVAEIFAILLPVIIPTATLILILLAYVDTRSRQRRRQVSQEIKDGIAHLEQVTFERIRNVEDRVRELERRIQQRWRLMSLRNSSQT